MPEDPAFLFFETAWAAMVEGNLARLEELTSLGSDGRWPQSCARQWWISDAAICR